ncbi:hypothetical protein GGI20_003626 [Coemansia sp. BCRC 34301]|nr:hypothetical protein GGI20_003626 [Coemansia sp. BCRC 34301]
MSFSVFRRVALVGGSGLLPASYIDAFKQTGDEFNVTVLTRKESLEATKQAIAGFPHLSVRAVDYDNESDLAAALRGQEVVISLLTPIAMHAQDAILRAALNTESIKWVLPSEFGLDLEVPAIREIPLFAGKLATRQALKEKEGGAFAYTFIVTGSFADMFVGPLHGWDIASRTVIVPDAGDKGTVKTSFSTRRDIAHYTVAVLRRFEQFANKTVRVASFNASYSDWINAIKRVRNVEFAPTFEPLDVLQGRIANAKKDPAVLDFKYIADQLHVIMALGHGRLDVNGKRLDSDDLLEVTPTPLESVVRDIAL